MPHLFSLYSYHINYTFNKIVAAMKNEVAALQKEWDFSRQVHSESI